jgi:ribosome-binding protein aMBF1 (putative translation factor)
MDGQDWEPIRIGTNKTKSYNDKRQTFSSSVIQQRKVEKHDGPLKVKSLSNESKQEMIRTRIAAGMNQQQLNVACAFPPHTIRDIECGKCQPSPSQLNILNRILKLHLKFS